jgi:hypothetical protein
VQSADGKDTSTAGTYFSAYHSGTKPWSFALADSYVYAGPSERSYYPYAGSAALDYHYRIGYDDGIEVGIKPASNFENGYFFASGQNAGHGTIEMQDIVLHDSTMSGTVTNGTDCDFPYLALVSSDYLIVLKDVAAGQTVDIAQKEKAGDIFFQNEAIYMDDIYYSLVGFGDTGIDPDLAAALFLGMNQTHGQIENDTSKVIALAPVRDYDSATAGDCKEISYGCLYAVTEQEVPDAAD